MNRMHFKHFAIAALLVTSVTSCRPELKADDLYGKWKYIKVQNTLDNPADTVSADEMKAADPSITFSKNADLIIMWDGKQFSTGKFKIEGNDIQYTENLTDGTQHTFPFYVRKIDKENLIFETKGKDGIQVTARRIE